MESWAGRDNPGLWVFAPSPQSYPWSMRAPAPTPEAHYVCRCGAENRARGPHTVKALISEYLAHMATEHPAIKDQPARRAA